MEKSCRKSAYTEQGNLQKILFLTLIINISINDVRLITRKKHYSYSQEVKKTLDRPIYLHCPERVVLVFLEIFRSSGKLDFYTFIDFIFISSQDYNFNVTASI